MALELRQQLKLSQQLVMTPQLQQAIKLLQLSRVELLETVQQELLENPFLEEAPANEPVAPQDQEESRHEKGFSRNADWEEYLGEFASTPRTSQGRELEIAEEISPLEARYSAKPTLEGHLLWQLHLSTLTDEQKEIGEIIIGNLGSSGYLRASVEEIAEMASATPEAVQTVLERVQLFDPVGVAAWEPFDADGEDQLYNYLGQCGLAVEPSPYFNDKAPTVLLTQSSACEPDAMEKLEKYVRQGGNAVVTVGFVHETYDKGIKDMTSVRLTHRHVLSNEFMVSNMNYLQMEVERSDDPILFEVLDYKTNATHSDITILAGEDNFPMMTEDNYGKGRLFILNVPENFADLYKLPKSVVRAFNKHLSMGQRVFVAAHPQVNFFAYDNNVYGIQSHRPMPDSIQVIVRGECKGLRDIETGRVYDEKLTMPKPGKKGDATTVIPEPTEYAFEVQMFPGRMMFFEVID